jgi:hypothetical protein
MIRREQSPELFAEEKEERTKAARDKKERERAFLFQRQKAYQTVFKKDSPIAQQVLSDLAQFCRASESTFHPDARLHALAEGRREVFLRIMEHLELPSEALWELKMRRGA